MVYSYQVVKFQTISFVQGIHWSQSVSDKGIFSKQSYISVVPLPNIFLQSITVFGSSIR